MQLLHSCAVGPRANVSQQAVAGQTMGDFADRECDWDNEDNRHQAAYGVHPCWGVFYGRVLDALGQQSKLLATFEDPWERSKTVYALYRQLMEGDGSELEDSSPDYRRWLLDQQLETTLCGIHTGEEGHDDGDDLIWASEHDSDDPQGFLRQLWDGEWGGHSNWGDEDLSEACWQAYADDNAGMNGGMTVHIQLYERIRDSLGEEFRKVREQVFEAREQRRALYLELDQDPEQEEFLHFSDYSDPLRNPAMLRILAFTNEQIEAWIQEAKDQGWDPAQEIA